MSFMSCHVMRVVSYVHAPIRSIFQCPSHRYEQTEETTRVHTRTSDTHAVQECGVLLCCGTTVSQHISWMRRCARATCSMSYGRLLHAVLVCPVLLLFLLSSLTCSHIHVCRASLKYRDENPVAFHKPTFKRNLKRIKRALKVSGEGKGRE